MCLLIIDGSALIFRIDCMIYVVFFVCNSLLIDLWIAWFCLVYNFPNFFGTIIINAVEFKFCFESNVDILCMCLLASWTAGCFTRVLVSVWFTIGICYRLWYKNTRLFTNEYKMFRVLYPNLTSMYGCMIHGQYAIHCLMWIETPKHLSFLSAHN